MVCVLVLVHHLNNIPSSSPSPRADIVDMSFKSALQLLNFRFQMTAVLKNGKLFWKAYTCGLGVCHFR